MKRKFSDRYGNSSEVLTEDEDGVEQDSEVGQEEDELLAFLFDEGILPSYAFPTDLCSFSVERAENVHGRVKVVTKERPQQSIMKGLSEYAPGRLIVIDKLTYRSGGVTASTLPTEIDRATKMMARKKEYIFCENCTYVQDPEDIFDGVNQCPVCDANLLRRDMVQPEVFYPRFAESLDESDRDQEITYATSAQFPKPTEENSFTWRKISDLSRYTHAKNCKLVIVNKGLDGSEGFQVCSKCGDAVPSGSNTLTPHTRPYKVESRSRISPRCDGAYEHVFLGAWFTSDLLLIRIDIKDPLASNINDPTTDVVLNSALRTLAEGLILAASRDADIDVDASEFSSGYRIVKDQTTNHLWADLYLFDTLSGGAGYSDIAGDNIDRVLLSLRKILSDCPGNCDSSCYQCIRHYANQIYHSNLDRFQALELLDYLTSGKIPEPPTIEVQIQELYPLRRMFDLAGYYTEMNRSVNGIEIPLFIKNGQKEFAIGTFSALINNGFTDHPLDILDSTTIQVLRVESFLLKKNLPLIYSRLVTDMGAP